MTKRIISLASGRLRGKLNLALLGLLLTIGSSNELLLAQNFFLPGDAFFSFRLSEELARDLKSPEPYHGTVEYFYAGDSAQIFSRGTGFRYAKFQRMDPKLKANFQAATEFFFEDGARETKATKDSEVVCFVLPNGFSIDRFTLGLRYNEGWKEAIFQFEEMERVRKRALESLGRMPFPLNAYEFVESRAAVEESWFDAETVPALNIKLPPKPWTVDAIDSKDSIVEIGGNVMMALVEVDGDTRSLTNIYRRRSEDSRLESSAEIVIVTADETKLFKLSSETRNWVLARSLDH